MRIPRSSARGPVGTCSWFGVAVGLILSVCSAERALAQADRVPDPDSLHAYAGLLAEGRFPEAALAARRSLARLDRADPKDPERTAAVLERLLDALDRDGYWAGDEYRALARRGLAARLASPRPDSLAIAAAQDLLAGALSDAGDYAEARPLYEGALTLRARKLGDDALPTAETRIGLALLERDTGHGVLALQLLDQSVSAMVKLLPGVGSDAVKQASAMIHGIWNAGDYAQSRYFFRRALGIWGRVAGSGDPRIGMLLGSGGSLFSSTSKVSIPQFMLEAVYANVDDVLGERHPDAVLALNGFGGLLNISGDFAGARLTYQRAVDRARRVLRPAHPDLGLSLQNHGQMLAMSGDLKLARGELARAESVYAAGLGPAHPFVASAMDARATLETSMGDYSASHRTGLATLAIREAALGPLHPDVAESLNGLATIDAYLGDFDTAKARLVRALDITLASLGPETLFELRLLRELGDLALRMGQVDSAAQWLNRANRLVDHHPETPYFEVASIWRESALMARAKGDTAAFRAGMDRAYELVSKMVGADNAVVADPLLALSSADLAAGERTRARERAVRAERLSRERVSSDIGVLPERAAVRFAITRPSGLDQLLTLALPDPARSAADLRDAVDALIRARGLALDELAARPHIGIATEDSALGAVSAGWLEARQRLANLALRFNGEPSAQLRAELEQAGTELDAREGAWLAASARFRAERRHAVAGMDEVRASLVPGTALVSYAQFETKVTPDRPRPRKEYVAFVITAADSVPQAVSLGAASRIDSLVQQWRDVVTITAPRLLASLRMREREAGERLRAAAWDPVAAELGGASHVLVVPDGALQLVNFDALPVGDANYLVEQRPDITLLSMERDLVSRGLERRPAQTLLALGGVDYERARGVEPARAPASAAAVAVNRSPSGQDPQREVRSKCFDASSLRFEPLPGSAAEVREISRDWRRRGATAIAGAPDLALTGPAASEQAFKALAPNHALIHVASHGFFLGERCGEAGPLDARAAAAQENPLLLSGLALAGANHFREANPNTEDGILTAEEIAALDLSGARCVVLSACGSGTGLVLSGEGVFGLRRAFAVAGARAMVMSLWPVDDEGTRRFMELLYTRPREELLNDPDASVRQTELARLAELRARGGEPRTAEWASFICARSEGPQ